jgi:predicted RNA binding protein YcfA (HicA-like mRNA interferase family)
MSEKLPVVSGQQAIKALTKAGFIIKRVTGSHYIMFNPATKKMAPVPYHGTIKKGSLNSIIKQSGLTREEFVKLL